MVEDVPRRRQSYAEEVLALLTAQLRAARPAAVYHSDNATRSCLPPVDPGLAPQHRRTLAARAFIRILLLAALHAPCESVIQPFRCMTSRFHGVRIVRC